MTAYDESGMGMSEYEARKDSSRKDARIEALKVELSKAYRIGAESILKEEAAKARIAELTAERDRLSEALVGVLLIAVPMDKDDMDVLLVASNALREVG